MSHLKMSHSPVAGKTTVSKDLNCCPVTVSAPKSFLMSRTVEHPALISPETSPNCPIPSLSQSSGSNRGMFACRTNIKGGLVRPEVTSLLPRCEPNSSRQQSKGTAPPPLPRMSSGSSRLNKFVRRLHDMLQSESDSSIVEWRRGLLVLHSTDAFAKTILPKYFNTCNFKTFRRQLNYYGFVHVRSFSTTGSTTTALWVNRTLAKHGSADISSVLMLKRVEPCESAKTAEGRRVRKEQAIYTVEEDIGVSAKSLQMEQIRSLAMRGSNEVCINDPSLFHKPLPPLPSDSPVPREVHCLSPPLHPTHETKNTSFAGQRARENGLTFVVTGDNETCQSNESIKAVEVRHETHEYKKYFVNADVSHVSSVSNTDSTPEHSDAADSDTEESDSAAASLLLMLSKGPIQKKPLKVSL